MKIEPARSSEAALNLYQVTQCYVVLFGANLAQSNPGVDLRTIHMKFVE